MRDTSDLKAWFREDVAHILKAVWFSSSALDSERRAGSLFAVVSVALAMNIPLDFIGISDMEIRNPVNAPQWSAIIPPSHQEEETSEQ